ncbi:MULTISPECIES: hypothetical protein [Polyangium]|uniref:Uncharacterized protein n=2 Tax=Polyangium TaxID=55 RepID=A0A4U1IEM3_9BACT|nr:MULTISPECIES: hypothetical protein [Polyangium]MDI1437669.1 hypothetical protein [Polyangium sorediatum]TKC92112.1 hypothetical protein E8A74_50435 [Polyangium fumosum]
MVRDDETNNPLTQGKGRTDEVDQSKGIYPFGTPHPPDAEMRPPGSLGGGSYEESGRGGVGFSSERSTAGSGAAGAASAKQNAEQGLGAADEAAERAPEPAPKGALPQHEESKPRRSGSSGG